jgi:hypothetical protein
VNGNAALPVSFTVTVTDNEAPTLANVPQSSSQNTDLGACSAVVIYTAPTVSDNCPGASVVCAPASGTAFAKGTTTVTCTATDAAGLTASALFEVEVVDAEAPTVTCPGGVTATATSASGANVSYSGESASDNCDEVTAACVPASGSLFPMGTTTVTCSTTDGSGNANSCTFSVLVQDVEAPVVVCPAAVSVNTAPGACEAVVNYTIPTATDNADPNPTVVCTPISGASFGKGTDSITCTATDFAGNSSTCTFAVNVTDAEAPVIAGCANIATANDAGQCSAVVNFAPTATDNCDAVIVTCIPASGTAFSTGPTTVNCSTADLAGNPATCSFTVTVTDTENPVLTACPANIVASTAAGQCNAVVLYDAPTASDNCAGVTSSCSPVSGSTFVKGTTSVVCTATDAAGLTATCSFTVTVNDTEAPVLACPGDVVQGNASGYVVTYSHSASDNCPGVTSSCSPASGSTFALGTTPVICSALDASSNPGSCTFTVTINDTTAPSITCPADVVACNDAGACNAVVNYGAVSGSDDVDGTILAVCAPASGSTFVKGTTPVICTVTDSANNSSSCGFNVTVNDCEAPVVSVPANQTVANDAGQCSAVVTYAASASDNCDAVTVVCAPASGLTFAKGVTTVNCSATDGAGKTGTASFTVTVNDTEQPTITCPANKTVVANSGCNATGVALGTAVASDNCPGVSVGNSAPGAFPIGSTIVTWTATDASGNTATCQQTVTVISSLTAGPGGFQPPLAGQPVGNKVKYGQKLPHKVKWFDCAGAPITSGITVRLSVVGKATGPGGSDQQVAEDANGVGVDALSAAGDGIMVLTDGQYHFNLNTNCLPDNNTLADGVGGEHYESTATAYDNATGLPLGSVTVNLETRP